MWQKLSVLTLTFVIIIIIIIELGTVAQLLLNAKYLVNLSSSLDSMHTVSKFSCHIRVGILMSVTLTVVFMLLPDRGGLIITICWSRILTQKCHCHCQMPKGEKSLLIREMPLGWREPLWNRISACTSRPTTSAEIIEVPQTLQKFDKKL